MAEMKAEVLIAGIDKSVSQLALGTAFYSLEGRETCFDLLDRYVELGGTFIDTARGYGASEDVLGLWLEARSVRDRIVLITKCGLTGEGVLPADTFSDVVRDELTTSLRTLKTDCVDLYLLHRDNQMMTVAEILEPLNREIAHGRVHAIERLDRAGKLGEQKGGYTAVEIALAWVLHKPFPIVPIVGPHTKEEVASCVKALSLSLAESEIRWLDLEAQCSLRP